GDVVVVGAHAAAQAPLERALRLGPRALRRRRHLVPPRPAGGRPRGRTHRHAGPTRVRPRGRARRPRHRHPPLRRRGAVVSEPVTHMAATTRLDYVFTAGVAQSKNLHGLEQGKFIVQRCPKCKKVYTLSRGSCPTDGVATDEIVELPNTGTVTTFCVVNVPFAGQSIEIPYICAQILLDGANLSFMGLIQEIPTDEIRMGLRVEAVWVEPDQLGPTMASVKYFRPTGEPDADYETYKEYL